MTSDYKKMMLGLIKNVAINLLLTAATIALVVFVLSQFFNVQLQVSGTALILAIIGTTLAFAGNNFVADALGRYDAHGLPQYIWGNRMQSVGFALTIAALLIR
jgi:hypothetical protein